MHREEHPEIPKDADESILDVRISYYFYKLFFTLGIAILTAG